MKKTFLFLSFLLIFSALSQAQGVLKFKKPILKLKPVPEDTLVNMEFEVTNIGNAPVNINDYEVACHCTEAVLPDNPIQPGETITLAVKFDTKEKSGWQYRTVTYFTDTAKGQETVEFRVKVKD
jgi:hypothetical protein